MSRRTSLWRQFIGLATRLGKLGKLRNSARITKVPAALQQFRCAQCGASRGPADRAHCARRLCASIASDRQPPRRSLLIGIVFLIVVFFGIVIVCRKRPYVRHPATRFAAQEGDDRIVLVHLVGHARSAWSAIGVFGRRHRHWAAAEVRWPPASPIADHLAVGFESRPRDGPAGLRGSSRPALRSIRLAGTGFARFRRRHRHRPTIRPHRPPDTVSSVSTSTYSSARRAPVRAGQVRGIPAYRFHPRPVRIAVGIFVFGVFDVLRFTVCRGEGVGFGGLGIDDPPSRRPAPPISGRGIVRFSSA